MFISLEGPEGSGKSTHAPRLASFFQSLGQNVLLTREPGGTSIGDQIRLILNDHANAGMLPRTEILLFCASRAQLVNQMIRPHLEHGGTVICDRFSDSTIAYHGYGHGLPLDSLRMINSFAACDLKPHLTFLLDLPVEVGLNRRRTNGLEWNRMDAMEKEFHQRVRQGYLELARLEPDRWVRINSDADEEEVWKQMEHTVRARLAGK